MEPLAGIEPATYARGAIFVLLALHPQRMEAIWSRLPESNRRPTHYK
jgi:hypothetical protein